MIDKNKQYRHVIINLLLALTGILLILLLIKFSGVSLEMIIESFKAVENNHLIAIVLSVFGYSMF